MSLLRNLKKHASPSKVISDRALATSVRRASATPRAEAESSTIPTSIEPGWLSSIVTQQDGRGEESRMVEGLAHVSSLLKDCPRAHALAVQDGLTDAEQVRSVSRIVWAMGRAVEKHVRDSAISALDFKNVFGAWRCPCAYLVYAGYFQPLNNCPMCNHAATEYVEHLCVDEEAGIRGGPDFLIKNAAGRLRVFEIKSLKKDSTPGHIGWMDIQNAIPDHAIQVSAYHRILQRNGVEVEDECTVLYANKDFSFRGSPYKEFPVDPLTPHIQSSLDIMWDNARLLRAGSLPPRLSACTGPSTTKARTCFACASCFNR